MTAKPVITTKEDQTPKEPLTKLQSQLKKPSEEEKTPTHIKEEPKQDVYSAMLEKIQKQFSKDVETKRLERLQLAEDEKLAAIEKQKQRQEKIDEILKMRDSAMEARMQEEEASKQKESPIVKEGQAKEEIELPDTILSFAGDGKDMFSVYMTQAEKFMKDGMYYKAADAYSLASAYQNQNPLPYMGRSIALFAAGEYMSSSYYLNMSLRIFEELALFKISVKDFIGKDDVYNKRLGELAEIQIQSGSPEMRFLMAYIYYVDGQSAKALDAINDASEKLTDDAAVQILKQAISRK